MKVIKYINLYRYLVNKEKMTAIQAIRTISRLRKIDPECLNALWTLMDGICPEITVENVTYTDLVDNEKMSATRALLYLDWLKREPVVALAYMVTDKVKETHEALNEDNTRKMHETARRLGLTPMSEEINLDETDIVIKN